jgi:hypothetical protein
MQMLGSLVSAASCLAVTGMARAEVAMEHTKI